MATEGLQLGPTEVKVTLSRAFAGEMVIRQSGFLLSETKYYDKVVALAATTKRLKSVAHLRLHTYGVTLDAELFANARDQLGRLPERQRLCPVFGGTISSDNSRASLVLFLDCLSGSLYRCACTDRAYSAAAEEGNKRLDPQKYGSVYVEARKLLAEASVLSGICHRCILTSEGAAIANHAYGREFTKHLQSYGYLYAIENRVSLRSGTERFMSELGLAKWRGEAELFEFVLKLFPDERIEREASPSWLNRQRFDIYLPEKNLALEYHGQQHFASVEFFGGVDALLRRQEMDLRKLETANSNGVKVLVFRWDQPMTMATVKARIVSALQG